MKSALKILSIAILLGACATKNPTSKNLVDAFSEGPCKFGRVQLEKDPELPEQGFIPAVFCPAKDTKEQLTMLDRIWTDYDWAEVYYDGKGRYVAVLDWAIEGGFSIVPVIESIDNGQTWKMLSKIEKPHFSARITGLKFDDLGNGELQMEWEPDGLVVAKLYSTDNGKNWITGSR